ncbi:MAG: hypothetical protein ABR881_20580 [Candidatus Sulfotelmatobacter sp.]
MLNKNVTIQRRGVVSTKPPGLRPGGLPRRLYLPESSLRQEFQQDLLAQVEGALHLAADEERVGDRAQKPEADFVFRSGRG